MDLGAGTQLKTWIEDRDTIKNIDHRKRHTIEDWDQGTVTHLRTLIMGQGHN